MHQELIQSIVEEVGSTATNNFLGKMFQLAPLSFAFDIGVRSRFLFISADPSAPRFYLIHRRLKDVERQSIQLSQFGQLVKAQLAGGRIASISKDPGERVVRLTFRVEDDLGVLHFRRLVAQLTGRAANMFVLDELNRITAALRPTRGPGQNPGEYYLPPLSHETAVPDESIAVDGSPSAAADAYFLSLDSAKEFDARISNARGRLRKTTQQKMKLRANLLRDLADHGDPKAHKRIGDLLLANISTAVRVGSKAQITDFYSPDTPTIEVDIDENMSLQEAAAQSFRSYTRAKRAQEEIAGRLQNLETEISVLERRKQELDRIARELDEDALALFDTSIQARQTARTKKGERQIPGVRRYTSTDGYEILVGRAARDNDNLTFRIARPNDLWLHAGDYPGSHVVVRNPSRKDIPQRTIIEAAQLAGRFSQASEDAKVVIHYTERKFLSKPKGAAPGIVRMSSFRSIIIEPKESVQRL